MSNDAGFLLALTADQAERKKGLSVIAKRLGLELVAFDQTPAALSWLMGHDPALVVLDARIPKAEHLGLKLRGKKALADLPVISLSEEMSDVFTANSYAAGADDVIPVHATAQLAQRLRSLPRGEVAKQESTRGVAVVADANRARCELLTRVLDGAGYDVKSAIDERSLQFYQRQHGPTLFVVNSELTDVRQAIHASRRNGNTVAWVITASRRELDSLSDALHDASRVVVTGANAPPTDALFLANELGYEGQTSRRRGSRKLLGTVVRFREAGTDEEDYGFTYNVSEQGVYVRTTAPPEYEEVWLELRPPKAKHWIRLLGRVAWRDAFSPGLQSLSPPGFGVELIAGLGQDLEYFAECFRAFADNAPRGAGRSTFVPLRRASVGLMSRIAPPKPKRRSKAPAAAGAPPSSKAMEVRDSWLSSERLASSPPGPSSEDVVVRDSEWDSVEAPSAGVTSPAGPGSSGRDEVPAAPKAGDARPGAEADLSAEVGEPATRKMVPAEEQHEAGDDGARGGEATRETPGDVAEQRGEARVGPVVDDEKSAFDGKNEDEDEDEDEEPDADDDLDQDQDEDGQGEDDEEDEDERVSHDEGRHAVLDRTARPVGGEKAPESAGVSFLKLLLIAGVTAGVTAAVYTASRSNTPPPAPASEPAAAREDLSPAAMPEPTPAAKPATVASGASDPAPDSPADVAAQAGEAATPFDVTKLESDRGALRITAAGPASVFVLGVKRGEVGDWITVKCGMQFVRLGRGDPPVWVSKGRTVVVPCKKSTTAEFDLRD